MHTHPADPPPSPSPIARATAARTGSAEHGALLVLVAALGLGAFGALGDGAGAAIAGRAPGRAGDAMVVHPGTAGGPTVATEAAVDVFARAARGLYKNVPTRVPRTLDSAATRLKDPNLFGILDREALSADDFVSRLRGAYPQLDEAGLRLSYDLLTEFKRLRDAGAIEGPVSWLNVGARTAADNVAFALGMLHATDGGPSLAPYVIANVGNARRRLTSLGAPIPEEFFARIVLANDIFGEGTTHTRIQEVFRRGRGASSASAVDDPAPIAAFLGRYEGVMPTVFASRYARDPAGALATLPLEAREYLEGDVLPILRSSFTDAGGETKRLFSRDEEAEIVAGIVGGNKERARAAAKDAATVTTAAHAEDVLDAIDFAASMFTLFEGKLDRVRRFDEAEASALVRLDGDLDALRGRTEGGGAVGDVLEVLRDGDFGLRPGRSAAHRVRVLESVLQAAARGLPDQLDALAEYLDVVFLEFPELLRDDLRTLAEHFAKAE